MCYQDHLGPILQLSIKSSKATQLLERPIGVCTQPAGTDMQANARGIYTQLTVLPNRLNKV